MKTSLKFERETKNTNVYKNDQEGAPQSRRFILPSRLSATKSLPR